MDTRGIVPPKLKTIEQLKEEGKPVPRPLELEAKISKDVRVVADAPIKLSVLAGMLSESMFDAVFDATAGKFIDVWSGPVEYAARMKLLDVMKSVALDAFRSALYRQVYAQGEEDAAGFNWSDDVLMEAAYEVFKATILMTALISEDAGEIVMEAFQEAFSNAVMYSLGGQFASVAAYRAGFMPPQGLAFGQGEDAWHPYTRGMIDAMAGMLTHYTVANEAARLASKVDQDFRAATIVDEVAESLETVGAPSLKYLAWSFELFRRALTGAYDAVYSMLAALLRRVDDVILEARGAEDVYNAGLISEEERNLVLTVAQKELEAISAEVDAILEDLEAAAGEVPAEEQTLWTKLMTLHQDLVNRFGAYAWQVAGDFDKYVEAVRKARKFQKVRVLYRLTETFSGQSKDVPSYEATS